MSYLDSDYEAAPQPEMMQAASAPSQLTAQNSMAPAPWPWQSQMNQSWSPWMQQPQQLLQQGIAVGDMQPQPMWSPWMQSQQASPNAQGAPDPSAYAPQGPMSWGMPPWAMYGNPFQVQQTPAPNPQTTPQDASQMPAQAPQMPPAKPLSPLSQMRQQMLNLKAQRGRMAPQTWATQMRSLYNQSRAGR